MVFQTESFYNASAPQRRHPMEFPWSFFIHLGIISLALLLGTLIRSKVKFFQKFLIPNALTAGFILLIFYNYIGPSLGLVGEDLGSVVYHLLNLSFIAMSLRKSGRKNKGKHIAGTALGLLSGYAIQATLGIVLTFLFIFTIYPNLFPSFGFFIPLGLAMGPGQAYAIGSGWEEFGFEGAGSLGLTFAAIGFVWASFGGFYLINKGIRKGWLKPEEAKAKDKLEVKKGIFPRGSELPVGSLLTTETEAIESMAYNLGYIFFTYLVTYLFLKGITFLLSMVGDTGRDLAVNLWGIAFIFCGIFSLLVKKIITALKIDHSIDNGTLNRFGGAAVDFMVAASFGAISIVIVSSYWVPILVMSSIGGILTFVMVPWMCSRMFDEHQFHRMLIIYGASTGTLSSGLVLLRVIDPQFETPTVSDYMYASALVFVLAIPLILMINMPAYGYRSGNPIWYWISFGICVAYTIGCFLWYLVLAKKKAFAKPNKIWHD